jgi:transcription elongation factor Elf1
MGKRKSSKPPPKKQRPKLDVAFNCPFCNSNKSVTALMDWDSEVITRLYTYDESF